MQIITQGEGGECDESDAVNILINTLHREGIAEMADLDTVTKLRTGKGRVSFDEQTQAFPQQLDEGRCVRRSLVIPSTPINKDHQTLLDTLAELACAKSPVRGRGNDKDSQRGEQKNLRPRAMSEPWLVDDFYSLAKTNTSSSGNSSSNSNGTRNILHAISQPPIYLSTALSELIPHPLGAKIEAIERGTAISPNYMVPVGIAAWASRKMKTPSFAAMSMTTANCNASSSSGSGPMSTHNTPLPQILEGDYSTVYNKNGRIGIYTREERQSIITRFQDKRRNRVWKKKIRYHCRKNLADRRVRIKGRFVRAVDGSSPLGESSDTRDTDIDTDKNLTGVGYREADYKEPEMDGVTSSEEGEINQPMDVSEVETSPSDTGGFFTSEGSAEDLRLAAALVADFSNHTDSSSSSDGSIRNFSRHKQQLGSQRAGEGQGSAADGMKAFWGVIHESSSSSSLNIASAMVSLSYDPASKDGITVQENGGRAIRHKAEENTEESENEDKIENDEAVDLWSENDNVEGLSDMDSQTKKRFRRYTIAY